MDRTYLQEYEEKELSLLSDYSKEILSNKTCDKPHPALKRISGKEPIIHCERFFNKNDGLNLWTQIPLAGTLIVPIQPSPQSWLCKDIGIQEEDFENLISLAIDTKRVKFVLSSPPSLYEGLNYLDKIFNVLEPPMWSHSPIPLQDDKKYQLMNDEFMTLAQISFVKTLQNLKNPTLDMSQIHQILQDRAQIYSELKLLGYNEVVEEIANALIDDHMLAGDLLTKYSSIVDGFFDPLQGGRNFSFERLSFLKNNKTSDQKYLPLEIGSFLTKKIVLQSPDYDSCRELVHKYKDNELYKLLESLNEGVNIKSKNKMLTTVSDLNSVLDNIWKDASRIGKQKSLLRHGIGVTIGVISYFSTSGFLGFGGLLASLGFELVDRALEEQSKSISERIVKIFNPKFISNVYDFQTYHHITT